MGLNESKGNMYDFINFTWNTIKGKCYHDCAYCHPPGTMIVMSDFTQKDIVDVEVGDKIIGISKDPRSAYYRFIESYVTGKSSRMGDTIRINTEDSNIICTKEHPLFGSTPSRNCNDWRRADLFKPLDSIRFLSCNSRGDYNKQHRLGYIRGIIDGDGCVFKHYNEYGRQYWGFEIVCVDNQLAEKIKHDFLELFGVALSHGIKRARVGSFGGDCPMLFTRKSKEVEFFDSVTSFRLSVDFAKGYIAGMIDTDGSVEKKGTVRITQSITANPIKHKRITDCCDLIGIKYVVEPSGIRICSCFEIGVMLLFDFGVFHSEKSRRLLIGSSIKGSKRSKVNSVSPNGECVVYNLQTECENFIANGFIVHNCFMKRWGEQKPVRLDYRELDTDLGENNFIFVGSSCDMFDARIPREWIEFTLEKCRQHNNKYFFQSKDTYSMSFFEKLMPINSSVCTTIETNRFYGDVMGNAPIPERRALYLSEGFKGFDKYVTIEPIMDFDLEPMVELIKSCSPLQVNLGSDSCNNKLPEPSKNKILDLIGELEKFTKIHNKKNLGRLLK